MDDKNNIYITNISSEQKKNVNHPKLSPIDLNSLIVPKHTTIECEHSITFPSITSVTSRNRTTSFREKVYKIFISLCHFRFIIRRLLQRIY